MASRWAVLSPTVDCEDRIQFVYAPHLLSKQSRGKWRGSSEQQGRLVSVELVNFNARFDTQPNCLENEATVGGSLNWNQFL